MAQQRQPDAQLQWDVYIGSGNREADMAARLRKICRVRACVFTRHRHFIPGTWAR
ncbi:MAG: hypothetical protein AAFV33_05145 [Chloroflexota bacterium]